MFTANVFKIAVVSLSGILDETYVAKEVIRQWNQAKASHEGKLFMPTEDPKAADALVGVLGNRVENAELIDEGLRAGKQVILLFNAYADPKNTIASEQTAVTDYLNQMQQRCFCATFNGVSELNEILCEQLDKIQ